MKNRMNKRTYNEIAESTKAGGTRKPVGRLSYNHMPTSTRRRQHVTILLKKAPVIVLALILHCLR